MSHSKLVLSSSFDPVTRLDTDAIRRVLESCPDMVVSVVDSTGGDFSLYERVELAQQAVRAAWLPACSVGRTEISGSPLLANPGQILDRRVEEGISLLSSMGESVDDMLCLDGDSVAATVAKRLICAGQHAHSLIHLSTHAALSVRLIGQYPVFVTGGMGAGKSTIVRGISAEAEKHGISVMCIELDAVWHRILDTRTDPDAVSIRAELVEKFGAEILDEKKPGFVNRGKLSAALSMEGRSFHPEKMAHLNAITWPAIERWYQMMIRGFSGLILVDGAMKNSDLNPRYFLRSHNNALIIDAPEDTRVDRVIARYAKDSIQKTEADVRGMMSNQPKFGDVLRVLSGRIDHEKYWGILSIENNGDSVDYHRELLRILQLVDRFGELRKRMASVQDPAK